MIRLVNFFVCFYYKWVLKNQNRTGQHHELKEKKVLFITHNQRELTYFRDQLMSTEKPHM